MRWLALLLIVATLSGCAQNEDPIVALDEPAPAERLCGVVVDDAIVPVAEATLVFRPGNTTLMSDESGRFCIVAPNGTFLVQASKEGHQTVETTFQVDGEPPMLRIVLPRTDAMIPTIVEDQFDGLISCSSRLPTGGFNDGCGAFGDLGLGSTQRKRIEFEEGNIDWIQTELVWEPNSALTETLCTRATEADLYPVGDVCAGPHQVRYLDDVQVTADAMDRGQWFEVIVFPDHVAELNETLGTGGLAFQQSFQLFTHAFYNMQPDEGWSFGADGAHPI